MTLQAAIENVRAYLRDMDGVPGYEDDDQLIASAAPVPPDGGSPGMITIGDLRTIIAAHGRNGWNIEEDGSALKICKGGHDKTEACQYERYVIEDPGTTEHSAGRMQFWLEEAQRLAALVTALGGNPEEGAQQPLEAPGAERYRDRTSELPEGVTDHLQRRLDAIHAIWAANGDPDHGHIAFLLRIARSYVSLPNVTEAAIERAEICKVLGVVDKPGVPLRHVQELLARKAKAYEREIAVLKMWDKANPTERQELDRMRRGWGPSSPTERMRRQADVLGCLQILSRALSDLSTPEEEGEDFSPEAQAVIDAAHDAVDKHHTEILIIHNALREDPQEWPDIRAAEERGAMAMRRILEEYVSGLEIIEKPTLECWKLENVGVARALSAVKGAPLPRDYHGSARDDVAKILG